MWRALRRPTASQRKATLSTSSASSHVMRRDVAVVGGGIVGLALAREIKQSFGHLSVCVVEKETEVAGHQSGRSANVLWDGALTHRQTKSGEPCALESMLCLDGQAQVLDYCKQHRLPVKRTGHLVVAHEAGSLSHGEALQRLALLHSRMQASVAHTKHRGVYDSVRLLRDAEAVSDVDPKVKALCGLYMPNVYVTDFRLIANRLRRDIGEEHVVCRFEAEVPTLVEDDTSSNDPAGDNRVFRIKKKSPDNDQSKQNDYKRRQRGGSSSIAGGAPDEIRAKAVVMACGMQADTMAFAGRAEPHIVPVRREWDLLLNEHAKLTQKIIQPLESIGINESCSTTSSNHSNDEFLWHRGMLVPRMSGDLWLGADTAMTTTREEYDWGDFSVTKLGDVMGQSSTWQMMAGRWTSGLKELFHMGMPSMAHDTVKSYVPTFDANAVEHFRRTTMEPFCINEHGEQSFGLHVELPPHALLDDAALKGGVPVCNIRHVPIEGATQSFALAQHVLDYAAASSPAWRRLLTSKK